MSTITHDLRIKESPIFINSVEGLKIMLGKVASDYSEPPLPVIVVSTPEFAMREIETQFNGTWRYPFLAMTLSSFAKNTGGYNDNLRRFGKSVVSNEKILTYKLVPIIAAFRVRYFTQDNAEMLKFSARWLIRQKNMQFTLTNDALNVNIKVKLNEDLSTPPLETTDYGNLFVQETSCDIETYIGEVETTTRINKINVNTNLWNNAGEIAPLGSQVIPLEES